MTNLMTPASLAQSDQNSLSVLLVDDHSLLCETLVMSLQSDGQFRLSVAKSIREALDLIEAHGRFDVVLLDYEIPGTQGLSGLTTLMEANGGSVALFSGVANGLVVKRALDEGASGFIPKTLALKTLKHAIRFISDGEVFVPVDFALSGMHRDEDRNGLKQRELQVLSLLGEGMQNKEIGRQLDQPETIVKLDVKSICRKLGVSNRTQAVIEARRRGLL